MYEATEGRMRSADNSVTIDAGSVEGMGYTRQESRLRDSALQQNDCEGDKNGAQMTTRRWLR